MGNLGHIDLISHYVYYSFNIILNIAHTDIFNTILQYFLVM